MPFPMTDEDSPGFVIIYYFKIENDSVLTAGILSDCSVAYLEETRRIVHDLHDNNIPHLRDGNIPHQHIEIEWSLPRYMIPQYRRRLVGTYQEWTREGDQITNMIHPEYMQWYIEYSEDGMHWVRP